jgi:hypothetical protein
VAAAQGKTGGASDVIISVTRERDEWHKSEATHGTMTTATVQPVGWLELTTLSTESATFHDVGCGSGQTMCLDGCADLLSDPLHCGSCSTVCSANQYCSSGQCVSGSGGGDCTTCETSADSGSCSSAYTTCINDSQCSSYGSCKTNCGTGNSACIASCQSSYPTGYSEFAAWQNCICYTACPSQCSAQCAQ